MPGQRTTESVERYLAALAGEQDPAPIVRSLLARASGRLHALCTHMLRRQYPRLTHAPLALQDEEMLSLLVERMLKALRQSRPATVRDFFALANQHLRWELNEFARQIDRRPSAAPLPDDVPATPPSEATTSAASLTQILEAIERLPDDLRESFSLVHVQGLTHAETAGVLAVSTKTIQRRLRLATAGLARELSGMAAGRGDEAFDPGGGAGP